MKSNDKINISNIGRHEIRMNFLSLEPSEELVLYPCGQKTSDSQL